MEANQAPPLEGIDLFSTNRPLVEATERAGAAWVLERAAALGRTFGGEPLGHGFRANEHPPRLQTHDRYGNRIDEVEFHPSWHALMELGIAHELHALPWREPDRPARHSARAALYMTATQAEAGFGCPLTMTYAAVPALRADANLAAEWEQLLTSTVYDPRLLPAEVKRSAICGMAMTERQGGSDVRANTTRARPIAPGEYVLDGHKWFCSAPMSDVFLVLAQAPEGLSCFLLPRVLPDGRRNGFQIERLKDKLGNRSNASAEVAFAGAWARLVGPPGRGVPTIIEMVAHTRLDCAIGAAAGMRWALAQAIHHATHRAAFGRKLVDQPLMRNVLADLAVESEAATALAMRLAAAYDEGDADFARLATAVGKYWLCKRAPGHAAEALECLGGNGFVEASGMPRLYREAPLGSIWEGSGNVICLDVLRSLARRPATLDRVLGELDAARGGDRRLDAFVERLREELADPSELECRARRVVEQLALGLSATLLVQHAPAAVADAFCAGRLGGGGGGGHEYGTLPGGIDFGSVVARNRPCED